MIRQPNVIFGNTRLLVTMGRKGELFGFFYPRRDHAQHVEDSLACIHTNDKLLWINNHEWHSTQKYIEDSNIVSTELSHGSGIKISILDFVHPKVPILIRKFKINSKKRLRGKFFYYSNLNVGEMQKKNSCFCDSDERLLVQYWQDYYIGLKGIPDFEQWQVGKAMDTIWWTNAKYDMEDGKLQNNKEDIGKLNSALGWDLDVEKGDVTEITVLIGAAQKRTRLYKRMRELANQSIDNVFEKTRDDWIMWLSKKNVLSLPVLKEHNPTRQEMFRAYSRSLLTLNLLNDPKHGSFIAAPEFDSNFEMCGGYGFCWNRDVVEVVLSLLDAGYPEYCDKFFKWCKKTQLSDGSWFQRYWLDGNTAPSWGNFDYSTQIDETGTTLYAIDTYYRSLKGLARVEFLEDVWTLVLRGAEYLMKRSRRGMHDSCIDLWETYYGRFSYTNASVYAGLVAAAHIAEEYDESGLADRWVKHADFVKMKTIEKLWLSEGYFAKGIIDKKLDPTVDASILGMIVPFNLLSPDNRDERAMIYSIIKNVEDTLRIKINSHYGIKRYENDNYIEGNPWIVTTLWLSKTMLALASALQCEGENEERVQQLVKDATNYIKWALKGTTSTGLLPEQVDKFNGHPAWAIPLGWSCALMLDNIRLLDEIQ